MGYLHIRVMLRELVRWRRQAARYNLSLSEFVRRVMNNSKIEVARTADPALIYELKRHGVLLNQLMHAIHAGFPMDPARVLQTMDLLDRLIKQELERR